MTIAMRLQNILGLSYKSTMILTSKKFNSCHNFLLTNMYDDYRVVVGIRKLIRPFDIFAFVICMLNFFHYEIL